MSEISKICRGVMCTKRFTLRPAEIGSLSNFADKAAIASCCSLLNGGPNR